MVLFPVAPQLEEGQFDALVRAASALGDDRFYFFTEQQSNVDPTEESGHPAWVIPFDYGAYSEVGALDMSSLCSPLSRWGMLVSESNESHAVIGGSDAFIAQLVADFPPTQEPVPQFHVDISGFPDDLSSEEMLDLMEAVKTPVPMRTGLPPGDGQVQALIEYWMFFVTSRRGVPAGRVGRLLRRASNRSPGTGSQFSWPISMARLSRPGISKTPTGSNRPACPP